ncbi:hypothetical protein [Pedobacter nanyangensis]|uniref:hypothetical protein n=1 Tax=Pedobacter nanyangensis TaxID=1562389 RepID=UPI000DE274E4|nr:hypothetical protein [Pedobacter nanyangensis]
MENFYLICECHENKFRVYLNQSNSDLVKKFNEINRVEKLTNKFVLVIEAVKINAHNKTQYNWEGECAMGSIYAIKIDSHRFYTLQIVNKGYRELYISRYGKKESEQNTKKLTATIQTIQHIQIQKLLS